MALGLAASDRQLQKNLLSPYTMENMLARAPNAVLENPRSLIRRGDAHVRLCRVKLKRV